MLRKGAHVPLKTMSRPVQVILACYQPIWVLTLVYRKFGHTWARSVFLGKVVRFVKITTLKIGVGGLLYPKEKASHDPEPHFLSTSSHFRLLLPRLDLNPVTQKSGCTWTRLKYFGVSGALFRNQHGLFPSQNKASRVQRASKLSFRLSRAIFACYQPVRVLF